jgi:uncharacterized protein YbbC (DUF1343 family)
MTKPRVQIGLERNLGKEAPLLREVQFGLVLNQASVDHSFRYACDVLAEKYPGQLKALFSPQHGLWGEQQANMVESPHGWYEPLGIPIYSLYRETREPTAEMLRGLDMLLIDLQDVGTRVYTFAWTVRHCLVACREANIPVGIFDRPNPLGGLFVEGALLDFAFSSFVGEADFPLRHGLTLGELALMINREQSIHPALGVIAMDGWRRDMLYDQTGRVWVAPSPNMPRPTTALLYPGQVLLEGTNLSEGRGTTMPFEVVGAPFIDPFALAKELRHYELPGLAIRPTRFVPTFDKWRGQSCGGIALHVIEPTAIRSVTTTMSILAAVHKLWPNDFAWLPPPYEYEREKMPIDILFGSSRLREALLSESPLSDATIKELTRFDEDAWWQRARPHLLYA